MLWGKRDKEVFIAGVGVVDNVDVDDAVDSAVIDDDSADVTGVDDDVAANE